MDPKMVRGVLLHAGVSEQYLKCCSNQLYTFEKAIDLLQHGKNWEGNPNEYLTKALGYDALRILEKPWESWDYYPGGIGVDWENCLSKWDKGPPKTVVIYNTSKIESFTQLYKTLSRESSLQEDERKQNVFSLKR